RLSYIPPRIISGHYLDVNVPEKSVGDKELIDDSIGIGKLSFADKTNNVFTKYERGIIDTSDNWKVKDSEDNKGVITIVPVKNNSTYFIRLFDESDRLRVIGTKEFPEKGIEGDTAYGNVNESSIRTINDTYDNNYLVIQVSNSGETPRIQITKDESSLNYTPNRQIDGYYLKDDSFGIDKLSFTTKSVNLFNGYVNGIIDTGPDPWEMKESNVGICAIVPVENNSTYVIRLFDDSDRLRAAGTKEYPTFDKTPIDMAYGNNNESNFRIINDTYDNNYLIIQVSNSNQLPRITVTKDKDYGVYIPPKVVKKEYLEVDVTTAITDSKPHIVGDFKKLYKSKDIQGVENLDLRNADFNIVYDEYDSLASDYSEIMNSKTIGYGTDSSGNKDTSLPIKEYTITNPHEESFSRILPNYSPTVLLITGVHGHEKTTVWGALQFFKQMLEYWYEDDSLASIKNNVTFKIIPVVNPGGFNNDVR